MTKIAAIKNWPEAATDDPAQIREWWKRWPNANIGVLTDGLVVIDIDVKDGKPGYASFLDLAISDDTFTVETPSGGRHLYYHGASVTNSTGKLGEGLDVRSHHGYVLFADSELPEGRYRIVGDHRLNPVPHDLIPRLDRPLQKSNGVLVEPDLPDAIQAARTWLERAPPAVQGHGGDDLTYRTAAYVKDLGCSEDTAFELMLDVWNQRCLPPWDAADLRTKVANAYAYGTAALGRDSTTRLFGDVQVIETPKLTRSWFDFGDSWKGSVDWLYSDLLPTTGVCLLSGPSGSGKTFIALSLAESLALGEAWFGAEPRKRGSTLILSAEGYGSLKLRMAALKRSAGLLPISATYVGALAAKGAWQALKDDLKAKAGILEVTHGAPCRLIILDTLSASGLLEDERDNAMAAFVIRLMAELSQDMNALFLMIHHPPKSGEGERGASALRNNSDFVLTIKRSGMQAVRDLEVTKSRDAMERVIGSFTLEQVVVGKDDDGQDIKTMRVSQGAVRAAREVIPGSKHGDLLIECIDWALVNEGTEIDGRQAVEMSAARAVFIERWPGARNPSNIAKAFKITLDFAISTGVIRSVKSGKREFLQHVEVF